MSMNYYVSHGALEQGTVIYLHGGAYIEEILPPHFAFAKQWTKRTGFTVITIILRSQLLMRRS